METPAWPQPGPETFEILAEVRYGDALHGALAQFARRARAALAVYGASVGLAVAAAAIWGGAVTWAAAVAAAPGCLALALACWLTRKDFRKSGGRPRRLLYRVAASGVEIRAAGRSDWIAWEDLWDVGETRRSFLLSPGPGQQYVIPKRCCRGSTPARLREALARRPRSLSGPREAEDAAAH